MRAVIFVLGTVILLSGFAGCKRDEKSPCQRLIDQEGKCGFKNGVSLADCEKDIGTVRMRYAVNCLKVEDCQMFLSCRKKADELKGLKTGLENL
jgi:hypothetical protein